MWERSRVGPLVLAPAFVFVAFAVCGLALAGGGWHEGRSSPWPRVEVSGAVVDHVVYVVGGFTPDGATTATVERLDLRTGRWSMAPPLPHPLNHASAVSYQGSLYVVGGYGNPTDTSSGAVSSFWRLDPRRGRWTAMPSAPLARAAAGAALVGHKLFVAGGRSDTETSISTLAIYNFRTRRWTLGPPLEHPREHLAGAAAAGAFWVFGGRLLGQGNFGYVERYRPGTHHWDELPPMPIPRSSFQAVNADGRIVLVGGEGPSGTIGEVDTLNPATLHWSRLPDLPAPRHGLALVASGRTVWAIDGGPTPGLTTSATVQRLRIP
jgi:non-specific serine/threonine protein kinase